MFGLTTINVICIFIACWLIIFGYIYAAINHKKVEESMEANAQYYENKRVKIFFHPSMEAPSDGLYVARTYEQFQAIVVNHGLPCKVILFYDNAYHTFSYDVVEGIEGKKL